MSRPLRIEFPGAVYHITSRGNGKQKIFFKDIDRKIFLNLLWEVVEREKWVCYAYCLMDNHYHLLVETRRPNLSRGMRELNGVYAQKLNYIRNSVGHVFQSRYKSILVQKDNYLLELCRYIALNPVRAGIVENPEDWKWSSYRATLGLIEAPKHLNISWVLKNFDENDKKGRKKYEKFVLEGIGKESPWNELRGRVFLGSKRFMEKHEGRLSQKLEEQEIAKEERFANRPSLEEIFKNVKTKEKRNEKIYKAYEEYRYSLKEIGDFFDIHYSTVSRIIKKEKEERENENSKNKT
jgi:REP element-mobilizing transposase RayT